MRHDAPLATDPPPPRRLRGAVPLPVNGEDCETQFALASTRWLSLAARGLKRPSTRAPCSIVSAS